MTPIKPHSLIKIKREPIDPNNYTECFWLEVLEFRDDDWMLCRVDNHLNQCHTFNYGDIIPVKTSEVYSCLPPIDEIEKGLKQ